MVRYMQIIRSDPAEGVNFNSVSPVTSSSHQEPPVGAAALNSLSHFGDWANWCLLCTLIGGVLVLGVSLS